MEPSLLNIEPKHFMHSPSTSEPVNRAELKQLFPMSALFTISVCSHHSCSTHLSLHRLLYWHNVGVFYLLSEGLPKSRHECWGKVFTRHAAHHHRQSSRAGPIGLLQYSLAQFTAGQVCFIASAVDRVVPVCGLSPASKHPAQIKEMRRIFN